MIAELTLLQKEQDYVDRLNTVEQRLAEAQLELEMAEATKSQILTVLTNTRLNIDRLRRGEDLI